MEILMTPLMVKEFETLCEKFFAEKNIKIKRIEVNNYAMKIFIDLEK